MNNTNNNSIEHQIETKMIIGSHGKYCVCLDTNSDWNSWLFQKHPDGQWVSLRLALPAEIKAAQHQLELLKLVLDIPVQA